MAKRKGMDVSTWNGAVDWKKVKAAGIKFVIIRAGFGNSETQQDNRFAAYMDGALSVGLPVGVYWFNYCLSEEDARKEAKACLQVLAPYKGKILLPVFADYEGDSDRYAKENGVTPTKESRTAWIRAFCDEIEKGGFTPGVYTNPDFIRNKLIYEKLQDYPLWLAQYGVDTPAYPCDYWQFTSTGKVNGISGNVDMNVAFKEYGSKPTSSSKKYGTCTGDGVRIRAEAHTAAKVLGSADKGDRLELLADDGWGWSKVKANGVTGWMYNGYINGPGRSKPKTVYCSGSYVNLRQGPSTSAKIVRQLQPVDTVTLVSINPDGWLDVDGGYLYYDKSYLSIR